MKRPDSQTPVELPEGAVPPPPPRPVGILMVDDHPGNLLALEAILRDPIYRLVKAASGREALKCLLDDEFAVILLDVKMPDMDGFETASLIRAREQSRHTPIIFLTAIDMSPAHVSRGYSVGAVDYLIKPFDPEILRSKVRGFVELFLKSRRDRDRSDLQRLREREHHRSQLRVIRTQRDRLFALSNDIMCLLDREGCIQEANLALERELSMDQRELRGLPFVSLFAPADRAQVLVQWERLREGGSLVAFETPLVARDGEVRWLAWSLVSFPNDELYYGVARDITEKVRGERELRRREQELHDFFENASLGLRWMGPDGTILRANRAELDMLGYSASEYVGRSVRDFHTDPQEVDDLLGRLARGETLKDHHASLRCRDGTVKEVLIDSNVLWEDGRFIHSRCFTRDVTAQKRAEEEIRRLNAGLEARVQERTAQLQEALQEQEQFAYSVSHDLRTPLRAMFGFSQALYEDFSSPLPPQGREYARRIMEATQRMDTLITDLLEYSRLSRSEIPLDAISLDRVFRQALRDLEVEVKERKAQVHLPGDLPSVRGHEVTLVQLVANLLSNAIKFVAPGVKPVVRITAERRSNRVRVWVEDNGIGIDPVHHDRIFRIFERLNRSEVYPGTGIGLAIVRKAAARMGGEAGVESDGRQGSRFWFELETVEGTP